MLFYNEIDKDAYNTYEKNIGNHIINSDIRLIKEEDLPKDIDVVIGGFPCQGFSTAGKRNSNDERNFLYKEMKKIISITKPKFFVAENVRGLLSMSNGDVIKQIIEDFKSLGYNVRYKLLYAPDYGIPQERYRVFIVGSLEYDNITFPEPTKQKPYYTVRDAIESIIPLGTLPNHEIVQKWPKNYDLIMNYIGEGQKLCNSRHSKSSIYTWDIPEVYGEINEEERKILLCISKNRRKKEYGKKDGNPLSPTIISNLSGFSMEKTTKIISSLLIKEYLIEKDKNKYDITKATFTRFKRIDWDKPSPTILTNFDNPRNYIHPSENRPLSVREVARLQTFPDDFIFTGTVIKQYTQVGNAVPPKLAYIIATMILNMYDI